MKRKKIFIGFMTLLNIAFLSLQLLAMGSLGLGFELPVFSLVVPLLLVLNLAFFIFWLVRFQWPLLLTVLAISLGYEELQLLYQIEDNGIRIESGISVMSYNVRSFNRFKWIDASNIPDKIENFINEVQPDIVCFQEYAQKEAPDFKDYPFKIFKPYVSRGQIGSCIISKFPLFNSNSISFEASTNGGMYADFLWKKDTLRLYNVHFESMRIDSKDTLIAAEYSQKLRVKIKEVSHIQKEQVVQFNAIKNRHDYPEIICTDLNNNAFSKSYLYLKQGRQDAFLERGEGFGATYDFLYFPLRIDFILTSPKLNVLSYKTHRVKLSDHKPISALIQWP
jgi:endonuclease/exonuclease/phosphatase family metal-dependent hydrolase